MPWGRSNATDSGTPSRLACLRSRASNAHGTRIVMCSEPSVVMTVNVARHDAGVKTRICDNLSHKIPIAFCGTMAIFEIADAGDEQRLWEDPTPEEIYQVKSMAWQFASPHETELHWGCETIRRQ